MVALALLGTMSSIVLAYALSQIISRGFAGTDSLTDVVGWFWIALGSGAVKAITIWAQEWLAQNTAARAKTQLRSKLLAAINRLGSRWLQRQSTAELNLLATSGLDALDAYFARFLPQLVYTGLAIPIFVVVVWATDPTSGIILVATLPLVPMFMMLIGWVTASVQNQQLAAMTRLSKHFLEVIRGLTTLRVFGRTDAQLETIAKVSDEYRKRTMKVLRVSFLSGFALELIASLSVALIAVSIGLRLVNAEMSLLAGLFVLLLAPDAYLPLRQVGLHFHASTEGVAASARVLDIIDAAANAQPVGEAGTTVKFETGKLTALIGPSGAGKSSIFHSLLGLIENQQTDAAWLGADIEARRGAVAWMPQQPMLQAGTVLENIVDPNGGDSVLAAQCLESAGADGLSLSLEVGESGRAISGGQARRVALARAYYRMRTKNCQWLWLDEPTASLDLAQTQRLIDYLRTLVDLGGSIVVITHDEKLVAAADSVIEVRHD